MLTGILLAAFVLLALRLERRRSAEFWAAALALHGRRVQVWSATAAAAASATIAAARGQALRGSLGDLRARYPAECIASGLLDPAFDREVEAAFAIGSSSRWDPARAGAFARSAELDAAHAATMQGGAIEWGQLARYGWMGALVFAATGAGLSALLGHPARSLAAAAVGAVVGFLVVGVERDRFWGWIGRVMGSPWSLLGAS